MKSDIKRHTETRLCAPLVHTVGVPPNTPQNPLKTHTHTNKRRTHRQCQFIWSLESPGLGVLESWSPTGRQSVVLGKQTNNENSTKGRVNGGEEGGFWGRW